LPETIRQNPITPQLLCVSASTTRDRMRLPADGYSRDHRRALRAAHRGQ
jgi:hypothetical protein